MQIHYILPRQNSNNLCWHNITHYDCTPQFISVPVSTTDYDNLFEIAVTKLDRSFKQLLRYNTLSKINNNFKIPKLNLNYGKYGVN